MAIVIGEANSVGGSGKSDVENGQLGVWIVSRGSDEGLKSTVLCSSCCASGNAVVGTASVVLGTSGVLGS